jgi:hypothetical protein
VEKAEKELETYRAREMKQIESDFDRAVKALGADGGKRGAGRRGWIGNKRLLVEKEPVGGLKFMACTPKDHVFDGFWGGFRHGLKKLFLGIDFFMCIILYL